jgi:NAD(P)-dependent dehydrogenase (short-subunit alcohol dehydrogenase family)
MARLDGKRVLVTGAASGIGRATAALVATKGGEPLVADLDLGGAEALASTVGAKALRLDITDPSAWATALAEAGPLDGLANCAGVDLAGDDIENCTPQEWRRAMDVNLDGAFLATRAVAREMVREGRHGSIVNISSVLGIVADGETVSYGSSKAGLRGLTMSASLALARHGIRCNTVHPGYIRTPMTERWLAELPGGEEALTALHPLGRLGEPDDVARLIVFLLGDEASYVTGAELAVDGGYLAV